MSTDETAELKTRPECGAAPNKAAPGNGANPVLFHAGRSWRAVPEHYLQLFITPGNPCFYGLKGTFDPFPLLPFQSGPDANPAPKTPPSRNERQNR